MERPTTVLDVTFTTDTAAYAAGDVLADTQEITNAFRVAGDSAIVYSMEFQDKADQGAAFDVVFFRASVSLGTENSAPDISDSDAESILGIIPVSTAKYKDLGGCRIATLPAADCGLGVCSTDGNSLFVGLISQGTGTYAATSLLGKITLLRE